MIGSVELEWGSVHLPMDELKLTVLAVVADELTRELLPKVVTSDRLVVAGDVAEGILLAETEVPDIAFVDVGLGEGAGLAMVHHLKALVPDATVFALASKEDLEAGAHAVSLGSAGLFLLPMGGDEVLNAVSSVRVRLAEQAVRAQLESDAAIKTREMGWIMRVAELADARDRNAAAQQVAEVFAEATAAAGAAVYLIMGDRTTELARAAATAALDRAPGFGSETDILDFARREHLQIVPLALRKVAAGYVLLQQQQGATDKGRPPSSAPSRPGSSREGSSFPPNPPEPARSLTQAPSAGRDTVFTSPPASVGWDPVLAAPSVDGLLKLLATQAATGLALLGERERSSGGAAMKDPSSSAYSFAFYVDVAGREIDKAKRHGRRFTIATVVLEPATGHDGSPAGPPADPAEVADLTLKAVRDTDILARVDENEFQLLMPETAGLEAHACYRRIIARLAGIDKRAGYLPTGLLVGLATFPHDGQGLAQLLRVARRRAEATKDSIVHCITPDQRSLGELLDLLLESTRNLADAGRRASSSFALCAPRLLELALPEAATLATSVVKSALRGGAVFIAAAHHPGLSLGSAVRAALPSPREDVVLHTLDVRAAQGADDIEALCIIAEHGAYAFMGRSRGGVLRGVHAADPLLADFLAERLGRAAGLRVFG